MEELIQALPPMIQKALEPGAPLKAKKMAASGRLPMSPIQLLTTLYALAYDQEPEVSQLAIKTLQEQPESTLMMIPKQDDAPMELLDLLARFVYQNESVVQAVVLHKNTPDPIIAWLATHIQGQTLELIAQNQQRQTRHHPIVASLLQNQGLPERARARVTEFALREKIETGLSDEEIAQLLGDQAAQELLGTVRQAEKEAQEQAKAEAQKQAEAEEESEEELRLPGEGPTDEEIEAAEIPDELTQEKDEAEEEGPTNVTQMLMSMNVSQKIKAAMKGNKQVRSILVNESNRLVSGAVLKNPGLTDGEVVKIASSRSVSGDVIRQISTNREWLRMYQVKVALVNNPKCPRGIAMRLIQLLNKRDLRSLSKNKGVPSQIAVAARRKYKSAI